MALPRGERIKLAREYHVPKMTQDQLGKMLSMDRTAISKLERKPDEDISVGLISQIARFTQVREEYFYDSNVEGPPIGYRVDGVARETPKEHGAERIEVGNASSIAQGIIKGDRVLLRCFSGVVAGDPNDTEAEYVPEETPRAVWAFITGGDSELHDVLVVRGNSMYKRIPHGAEVVVRHEKNPRPGQIVVAKDPNGATFIKIMRLDSAGREFLESDNPEYAPITNVAGWEYVSVAIAIISDSDTGSRQIEWDEGRALRG